MRLEFLKGSFILPDILKALLREQEGHFTGLTGQPSLRHRRVDRTGVELAEVVAQSFPVGFEHGLEASH